MMSKKKIYKKFKGSIFTGKWLKMYMRKRTTKRKYTPDDYLDEGYLGTKDWLKWMNKNK